MPVTNKKYLDLEGLSALIAKLKAKNLLVEHTTRQATNAAAVKVGQDQYGHVIIGTAITPADIGAAAASSIGNGTLTIQANGTTKGTFSANQSTSATINILASDFGLDNGIHYLGKTTSSISDGSTTNPVKIGTADKTAVAGDIVLSGDHKEFIWNGAAWELFGDEGSYALNTIQVNGDNNFITGGGTLENNITLSHKTYATADPAAVKVGRDAGGHVNLGTAIVVDSDGAHTHSVNIAANKVVTAVTPTSANYLWTLNKGASNANMVSAVTGVTATMTKLDCTNIRGVSGTASVSQVSISTNSITYGTANAGTAIANIAQISDTTSNIGNANVGGNTTVVTGFAASGQAFQATYSATAEMLQLTPLTLNTATVTSATGSSKTLSSFVTAKSITPAVASTKTFSNATVTATPVTVATAAESTTKVATGSVNANGSGADISIGISTPSTKSVFGENTTVTVSTTASGGTALVNSVTSSKSAVTDSGTATSAGAHTHSLS